MLSLSLWKKKKSFSFDKVDKDLFEAESIALRSINKHKDLIIQKTCKGNTEVITERTKYLEGIKLLLSESNKFLQLPIDEDKWVNYIINAESKLKHHFKVPKNEDKISEKEFDSICPVGTFLGILYGNLKVHKTVVKNIPKFRSILSAINTPTYLLAKYLNPIFCSLTTNEYSVKCSFGFEVVNYDHNLAIELLFTNITLEELCQRFIFPKFLNS